MCTCYYQFLHHFTLLHTLCTSREHICHRLELVICGPIAARNTFGLPTSLSPPKYPTQNLPTTLVATIAALCGGRIHAFNDQAGFNLFQPLILARILPPPLQSSSDLYYSLHFHSETLTDNHWNTQFTLHFPL